MSMSELRCTARKSGYRCDFLAGHYPVAIPEFQDGTVAFNHGCNVEVYHVKQFYAWDEDGVREILVGPPMDEVMRPAFGYPFERQPSEVATGTTSDGHHTFDELYAHRTMLLALVTALSPRQSWRSKAHEDGSMFEGMFVVGISAPYEGQITYHCDLAYWDCFKHCVTLPHAPHFDGHTSEDVLVRLGSWLGSIHAVMDILDSPRRPDLPAEDGDG